MSMMLMLALVLYSSVICFGRDCSFVGISKTRKKLTCMIMHETIYPDKIQPERL